MRHEQPRRTAVLWLQRLAPVLVGDPCLPAGDVLQRQIRGVAPSLKAVTYPALVSTPSSRTSRETPVHTVSSFDHLVTQ